MLLMLERNGKPAIEWRAEKKNAPIKLTITDNDPGVQKVQIEALYNEDAFMGTRHGLGCILFGI